MKKANIYILAIVILLTSSVYSYVVGEDSVFLPWKVGDSWKVRIWYAKGGGPSFPKKEQKYIRKRSPAEVLFKVKAIVSLRKLSPPYFPSEISKRKEAKKKLKAKDYKCFEIQVTHPKSSSGFQRRYLLYFRKDTKNLIRVLNNSIRTDGSIVSVKYDYPIDPNGPVFTKGTASAIPFDWPNWQKEKVTVEKKPRKGTNGDTIVFKQDVQRKTIKEPQGKSFNGYVVELKLVTKQQKTETEEVRVISTQKWKEKAKWWSQAIRYDENGEITHEAELIEDN